MSGTKGYTHLEALMQKKRFTELGLSAELLKAIHKVGYEEASHIQSEAIPFLLQGSDVVGMSQTGSGKTAAFAIPAIEKVDPSLKAPQILILCPTRELAVQVAEEVSKLAAFKVGVRELPIYGGQSYERQFRGLQQGAQIIVGTPGRVMDHLQRKSLILDKIKMVILDEADRMLDMGFLDDIKIILKQAPKERQTVFFSATLPRPIQELIKTFTRNPKTIEIAAQAMTVPSIEQIYYEVDRRFKIDVLCRIIDIQDIKFGIIFCATKMMVDDLTEHLTARGYAADKMHGDMTQPLRERVIAKFRKRGIEFLIATDVAARGLDVDDIEVVFNYDLPNDGEDYIHRIGRTGRAGRKGRAITFVSGRELYKLQSIIRFTKGTIRQERVPSVEQVEDKRNSLFGEALRELLEKGTYPRHDELIKGLLDQGYASTDVASALIHMLNGDKPKAPPAPAESREARGDRGDRGGDRGGDRFRSNDRGGRSEGSRERFEREDRPSARSREGERRDRPERAFPTRDKGKFEERPKRPQQPNLPREAGMTRVVIGVGTIHEVKAGEVLGMILESTHLPKESVGAIRLYPKQTLVDVKEVHAAAVIQKVNGLIYKERKVWCKPEGA